MKRIGNALLYHGNCCDILSVFKDECIDFIVTDPPYECATTYVPYSNRKDYNSDWGEWDVFQTDWIASSFRVLKKDSGMVVFVPVQRTETLIDTCHQAGFTYIQPWFWHKKHPRPAMGKATLQWVVEIMIYFRKGGHRLNIENQGKCSNLFHYSAPHGRTHPTQKPVLLLQEILEYVSQPGDIILDPFSGNASTGIAATECDRAYIGTEADDIYFNRSYNRLRKHKNLIDSKSLAKQRLGEFLSS